LNCSICCFYIHKTFTYMQILYIFKIRHIYLHYNPSFRGSHEILTSVIFTNNKRVGLKWALSLANPISCLGSVPCDLFKSFLAEEILWHHNDFDKLIFGDTFVPYKEVGDKFVPYMEVMLSSRFERLNNWMNPPSYY
jgi:hypothetical protein